MMKSLPTRSFMFPDKKKKHDGFESSSLPMTAVGNS